LFRVPIGKAPEPRSAKSRVASKPLEANNHDLLMHEPAFAKFIDGVKEFLTDPS
jgi:hypothetical protein